MSEDYKGYILVPVQYMLSPREQEVLKELTPHWQSLAEKKGYSGEEWTIEKTFKAIMGFDSMEDVARNIQAEQIRQGMIKEEEREKDGFRTMAERRKEGATIKETTMEEIDATDTEQGQYP